MGQSTTTTKPKGSKCADTSPTTKSYTCTSCPSSCCTFVFYFIGGVGEDNDPSKYAIPIED